MRYLNQLYEYVWRPTAGMPYTYLIRRFVETDHPVVGWSLVAAIAAACLYGSVQAPMLLGWWSLVVEGLIAFVWLLGGHCFWDTAGAHFKRLSDFARGRYK